MPRVGAVRVAPIPFIPIVATTLKPITVVCGVIVVWRGLQRGRYSPQIAGEKEVTSQASQQTKPNVCACYCRLLNSLSHAAHAGVTCSEFVDCILQFLLLLQRQVSEPRWRAYVSHLISIGGSILACMLLVLALGCVAVSALPWIVSCCRGRQGDRCVAKQPDTHQRRATHVVCSAMARNRTLAERSCRFDDGRFKQQTSNFQGL